MPEKNFKEIIVGIEKLNLVYLLQTSKLTKLMIIVFIAMGTLFFSHKSVQADQYFNLDWATYGYPQMPPDAPGKGVSIGGFTQSGELSLWYWSWIRGGSYYPRVFLKKNAASCNRYVYDVTFIPATGRNNTGLSISPGENICIYVEDTSQDPPASYPWENGPWPSLGFADTWGTNQCGENGWGPRDANAWVTEAQSYGMPLISKQCWGDWPEQPLDQDFEDYFIVLGYTQPRCPVCNSWTNINMSKAGSSTACTSTRWNATPRDAACVSPSTTVTINLNTNDANWVRFIEIADTSRNCADVSNSEAGWSGWFDYSSTRSWTLTTGTGGDRKVCAQFRNATCTSNTCGAMINYLHYPTMDCTSYNYGTRWTRGSVPTAENYEVQVWGPGSTGPYVQDGLVGTQTTFQFPSNATGQYFYGRTRAVSAQTVYSVWSSTKQCQVPAATCTLTLNPSSVNLNPGATQTFTASVVTNPAGVPITHVAFDTGNSTVATVNPAQDTTSYYQTTATAVGAVGTGTTVRARAYINGSYLCQNTSSINITNPNAWWQVQDADVVAKGNLTTRVFGTNKFNIFSTGNTPGVPFYLPTGSTDLTSSNVSAKGWLAKSNYSNPITYNNDYFEDLAPVDFRNNEFDKQIKDTAVNATFFNSNGAHGQTEGGYSWYKVDRELTSFTINGNIDFTSLGPRRVVLFVPERQSSNTNLNINGNIILKPGIDLFMIVSGRNILVNSAATNLNGVFLTERSFRTGSGSVALTVRGTVVAYGGVNFQRNLANNLTPAEIFQFGPEYVFQVPHLFGIQKTDWQQVNPEFAVTE